MTPFTGTTTTGTSSDATRAGTPSRRYRREASIGPRCPQCAGPLVFGEGCSLCPICGYSGCSV